ncbi:hypothetical protein F5148DRAFT_1295437 [Russula earlei]|uniref:Uncharacterized protein n=1 Tax=Russula earlei TaxID=71964 RepID=A0ACC0TRV5_9AGAM|nr:hypothetical protein F5148DRAFT_1295437 [Russula earlei]
MSDSMYTSKYFSKAAVALINQKSAEERPSFILSWPYGPTYNATRWEITGRLKGDSLLISLRFIQTNRFELPAGMVKFNDPVVVAQDFRAVVNLWHIVDGLYMCVFLISLPRDSRNATLCPPVGNSSLPLTTSGSVIQGHRPYRWTIWLYSLTRISTLLAMIVNMIGFDTFRPINCQLWVTSEVFFAYFAVANASMLIVLRVIAVWNQNRIVFAISMSTWVANISALIHSKSLTADGLELLINAV